MTEMLQIHMKSLKDAHKVFNTLFDEETTEWLLAEMAVRSSIAMNAIN